MIALLLLAGLVGVQDPAPEPVDVLIRRLSDFELEVRERAKAELFKRGPSVLEALRKHLVTSDPAVTAELKSIIAELEREIMLAEYRGKPSLIRLKADRQPLKRILAAIGEQSRTPILLGEIPQDDLVSIELERVPFFEAIDLVCRAHKGLRMKLENTYPPGEEIPLHHVRLVRGQSDAAIRHVEGQVAVELESLVVVRSSDFTNESPSFEITVRVAWERGSQPIKAELTQFSAIDEKGNRYKGEWPWVGKGRRMFIPSRFQIPLDQAPPSDVRKFREISGVIELDFPSAVEVLRLQDPGRKVGVELEGAQFRFKLVDFREAEGGYVCVFEHPPAGHGRPSWDRDMRLVDSSGKSYLGESIRMISGDVTGIRREVGFQVPAGVEIAELRHTDFVGGNPRRLAFRFKDVSMR